MSARLPTHLHDAARAAALALEFVGGCGLDGYRANALLRSAVERQVEIVGEACRRAMQLDDGLRARMPEMVLAVAMRNRIAHGYDTVDDTIVFDTVTTKFPALVERLRGELGDEEA